MSKLTDYFGGEKRFYIILVVLFIMWLGVMVLFYLKADETTKNPCSICAEKIGEAVECRVGSEGRIIHRVFYPNFSIADFIEGEQNVLP